MIGRVGAGLVGAGLVGVWLLAASGAAPAAASGFVCAAPTHHDGDAIHCAGAGRSDRLFGIDAPEMPGACRPGRRCTPGDPFAARDHLAELTRGRTVTCDQRDTDVYGRRIVRCSADGTDLSCAMVADGYAVERYGRLDCQRASAPAEAPRHTAAAPSRRLPAPADARSPAPLLDRTETAEAPGRQGSTGHAWGFGLGWLALVSIAAYLAFAIDKRRAGERRRRRRRIPELALLALAAAGGSIGAVIARQSLRHKTRAQPFGTYLMLIIAVQIGVIIGLILTR